MTDQTTPTAPVENVRRGALVALLTIPLSILAFAVISGFFGLISGFTAIVIPVVASWLYTKGAGAPLTRAGWAPFIGISAVSVVLGVASGIIASAYYGYERVGGDGGILAPAFWTSVRNLFSSGFENFLLPVIFGLGLGAAMIFSVIRGPRAGGRAGAGNRLTPAQVDSITDAQTPVTPQPSTTPPATPPAAAPIANKPSPGIMLNGEPLDPKNK